MTYTYYIKTLPKHIKYIYREVPNGGPGFYTAKSPSVKVQYWDSQSGHDIRIYQPFIKTQPELGSQRKRSNFGFLYFRPNSRRTYPLVRFGLVGFSHAVLMRPEKSTRQKSDVTRLTALCTMATAAGRRQI